MGSKVLDACTFGGRLHDVPDCFGRDSVTRNLIPSTHSPKDQATIDTSRSGPFIDGTFYPRWDRNGADTLSLAN